MPAEGRSEIKGTVIVVHGTFDAPQPGVTKWYQPSGTFCRQLDQSLQELGCDMRCWKHCEDGKHQPFSWNGLNDWKSRHDASLALQEYLKALLEDGWWCHLVGHSHGGNVIVRALSDKISGYLASHTSRYPRPRLQPNDHERDVWYGRIGLGEIVCMGTPFLDLPHLARNAIYVGMTGRERVRASFVSFLVSLPLSAAGYVLWRSRGSGDLLYHVLAIAGSLATWGYTVASGVMSLASRAGLLFLKGPQHDLSSVLRDRSRATRSRVPTPFTHLLAQSSKHDEAWILLRTLEPTALRLRTSIVTKALRDLTGGLRETLRAARGYVRHEPFWTEFYEKKPERAVAIASQVQLLIGIAMGSLVLLVLLGAVSWITGRLRTDVAGLLLAGIAAVLFAGMGGRRRLKTLILYVAGPVRKVVSAVLLEWVAMPISYDAARRAAHGLDDFPYKPETVIDTVPFWCHSDFFIFEEISGEMVTQALTRRQVWFDELMANLPKVASDSTLVADLLAEIVGEPSFVHSAYYLSPENAVRIADFLVWRQ